jgi:hypothetical protein
MEINAREYEKEQAKQETHSYDSFKYVLRERCCGRQLRTRPNYKKVKKGLVRGKMIADIAKD